MTDVIKLIQEHGVTVVVLGWFMLRAEKRMDRHSQLLESMMAALAGLAKSVDGLHARYQAPPELEAPPPPPPRRRLPTAR